MYVAMLGGSDGACVLTRKGAADSMGKLSRVVTLSYTELVSLCRGDIFSHFYVNILRV